MGRLRSYLAELCVGMEGQSSALLKLKRQAYILNIQPHSKQNSVIGIAVSARLPVGALGSLNGRIDAKVSKIKRLRTESDEARINLSVFVRRAISFAGAFEKK